ncbi:MAG: 50S ribosomal protein L29 [Chloroflexi bacterium]|nr:50S ribosomal protein L29 [Chloroflexota bacterium]
MRAAEVRKLEPEDLEKQLEESRRELFNLRFRLETRQQANSSELGKVRRTIARILTVMTERRRANGGKG